MSVPSTVVSLVAKHSTALEDAFITTWLSIASKLWIMEYMAQHLAPTFWLRSTISGFTLTTLISAFDTKPAPHSLKTGTKTAEPMGNFFLQETRAREGGSWSNGS
nr:hypothetical protein CFP56_62412 [Quercus suber]